MFLKLKTVINGVPIGLEIIDFERKGNLIRFYLGKNGEQWGDDWDDTPYDCNAGNVYDEYVIGTADVAIPYDYLVLEPCNMWGHSYNCGFCKKDMIDREIPCIIIVLPDVLNGSCRDDFDYWVNNENVIKIYFGDNIRNVLNQTPKEGFELLPEL